jgi:hypothetical protein
LHNGHLKYESEKVFPINNPIASIKLSNRQKNNKKVLVAPLDWGLGHATRCIPVVRALLDLGCEPWIATSGPQENLLKEVFPDIPFLHLPGYNVHYGKHGVMLQLFRQIPVIRRHIFTEHAWLQEAIARHGFHGIVSDNRYGLYSEKTPSVLITHQLSLQVPLWAAWFKSGVTNILNRHIEQFGACWIPDLPDDKVSLAGNMSHPGNLPNLPVHYVGWLSRFHRAAEPPQRGEAILISLSGPEPQRSLLEEMVLLQAPDIPWPIWLIRGLPGEAETLSVPPNVTVYNHLPAPEMQDLMARCQLLVSRSGYSTLMDAMVMQTPVACIPTPGQTEQEYLAIRMEEKGWGISSPHHALNLKEMITAALRKKNEFPVQANQPLLYPVMQEWLESL